MYFVKHLIDNSKFGKTQFIINASRIYWVEIMKNLLSSKRIKFAIFITTSHEDPAFPRDGLATSNGIVLKTMFQKQQPDIAAGCTKKADVETTITASSWELPLAAIKDYRLITLYLSTNLFGNIYFKQIYTMEH